MIWWGLVFWFSVFMLWLAYAGYPLLLWVASRTQRAEREPKFDKVSRSASVVLVVRNEEERVLSRLVNLLEGGSDEVRELIVVCDGCSDLTAARVRALEDERVKVIEVDPGRGKPAGVNAGVSAASGEVVVLCDARQRFDRETIRRLVAWFDDPLTGAVSGALEIERSAGGAGGGVDAYWKLEKAIRQWESDLDSSVGCTGAVYAIRRDAFTPMDADIILDDVVVPMQIAAKGLRVRFDSRALAFDPQTLAGEKETSRKVRTLAGNFQMLARHPEWCLPWGHRLWWKLVLHKYLRLAGPLLLGLAMVAVFELAEDRLYRALLILHLGFYAAAVVGWWFPRTKSKMLSLPAGFVFLQVCVVRGFLRWLRMDSNGGWK